MSNSFNLNNLGNSLPVVTSYGGSPTPAITSMPTPSPVYANSSPTPMLVRPPSPVVTSPVITNNSYGSPPMMTVVRQPGSSSPVLVQQVQSPVRMSSPPRQTVVIPATPVEYVTNNNNSPRNINGSPVSEYGNYVAETKDGFLNTKSISSGKLTPKDLHNEKNYRYPPNDHLLDIFAFYNSNTSWGAWFESGKHTDLVLIPTMNGHSKSYRVHRLILEAIPGSYFASLINSGMRDANQGTMYLDNIDPDLFGIFLRCIYNLDIEDMSIERFLNLLLLSSRMGIHVHDNKFLLYNLEYDMDDYIYIIDYMNHAYDSFNQDMIDYLAGSITGYVDLSSVNPEFVELILSSPYYEWKNDYNDKIVNNLLNKGFDGHFSKYLKDGRVEVKKQPNINSLRINYNSALQSGRVLNVSAMRINDNGELLGIRSDDIPNPKSRNVYYPGIALRSSSKSKYVEAVRLLGLENTPGLNNYLNSIPGQ